MLALGRRAPWMMWLTGLVAPAAGAVDDAAIYAQIDAYKPVAEAIVVDGNPGDWGAIPAFPDPAGDAVGDDASPPNDPTRDITSVRIAPTADALYVLIQTAAAPSTGGYAFWLEFDFMGGGHSDIQLAFDTFGPDGLSYFEETGCYPSPVSMDWDESEIAIGSAVEIRVPYAALDAVLPASMQGKLTGSSARSWVRVFPFTVDYDPFLADRGAAVAGFRLVTTPYALDPPLPPGGGAFTALATPLVGLWHIGQGAFTLCSHAGKWAYDLTRTDNALLTESPILSSNNAHNFSFGQPILAPAAGTVFSVENSRPDHPAFDPSPAGPPNFLFLEIAGNLGLLFSHPKQGSIPYSVSDPVAVGAQVAQVGNSGTTGGWPHLHYEAQEIDNGFESHPLGISNAQVGLNPTAVDPWRRDVASWGIREGFFVLPEPGALLSLAASAALLALLRRARD